MLNRLLSYQRLWQYRYLADQHLINTNYWLFWKNYCSHSPTCVVLPFPCIVHALRVRSASDLPGAVGFSSASGHDLLARTRVALAADRDFTADLRCSHGTYLMKKHGAERFLVQPGCSAAL